MYMRMHVGDKNGVYWVHEDVVVEEEEGEED